MKNIICSFFIIVNISTVSAQIGTTFPDMETETLTNNFINVPKDISGKHSIIGLAFSKKSEQDLKTWYSPIFETFLYKKENPGFFDISYDVNGLFVPMFSGAKKAAYGKVMKKMKQGLDPKLQPYVAFYKGALGDYKDALNFKGKDVPYFYVLDPEGKIIYTTSGRYSTSKMQEIIDAVQDAMDME